MRPIVIGGEAGQTGRRQDAGRKPRAPLGVARGMDLESGSCIMTTRRLRAMGATLVLGTLPFLSSAALAGSAEQACAPEIQTYCANVPRGGGKVVQCLKSHQQQLSPACQQGMVAAAALMKEVVAACADDLHQFCAGAAPGTVKDCLKANFRQLSFGCKKELFEAKRAM